MDILSKQNTENSVEIKFQALSINESFARIAVSGFMAPLNPTMEEISDVKTAVSEAVTNAIIHAYGNEGGIITMRLWVQENELLVEVIDEGIGMSDVEKAMEPLYTTKPELERSGMGFSFMEAFMDELEVISEPYAGTSVLMKKRIGKQDTLWNDEV